MSTNPCSTYTGFKQTEVGLIPTDWDVTSIAELTKNIIDYRGRTPKKLGLEWGGGDIVALSAGNVKKGFIDFRAECYLGSEELYNRWMTSGKPEKDDIAFTMEAPLGNVALIPDDNKYILSQRTILLQINKEKFSPHFVFQVFMSSGFADYISDSATGSTAQGIKRSIFEKITIPTPKDRGEQIAIANALSDADALIQELEKLIAKKQAIKTATMQQLLTGRTRLPPFGFEKSAYHPDGRKKGYKPSELGEIPEDWEFYNLPEKVWFQEGPGLRKWQFTNKGLKVINVTNLQENGFLDLDRTDRHVSWEEFEKTYKHFACDEGDLVIASSGNSYCKVSIVRACDLPLLMNTSVIRFKPLDNFSKQYMDVFLKSKYFKDQIDLMITGGAQPNFGPAHLNLVKILAPTCNLEQDAVASILCDMDEEIQALEQRLSKTRQIKQGMMQELLTGKTRLVKPESSV